MSAEHDADWLDLRQRLQQTDLDRLRAEGQAHEVQQLLEGFQKLISRYPEDRQLPYERGLLLWRLGRLAQAQQDFEALLHREPHWGDALAALAQVTALQGHVDTTYRLLQSLLELEPAAVRSHQLLLLYYELTEQNVRAQTHRDILQALQHMAEQARLSTPPRSWELQDCRYYFDYFSHRTPLLRQLYLQRASRFAPPQHILEIGCFEGLSASWMMRNLQAEGGVMECIDPWDPTALLNPLERFLMQPYLERNFDWNVRQAAQKTGVQLKKHKATSEQILPLLQPEAYDLIYIDGSHLARDVLCDMVYAWRLLKAGGLLFCDDYLWKPDPDPLKQPQLGVDSFLKVFQGQYELVHQDWVVVIQKKSG